MAIKISPVAPFLPLCYSCPSWASQSGQLAAHHLQAAWASQMPGFSQPQPQLDPVGSQCCNGD